MILLTLLAFLTLSSSVFAISDHNGCFKGYELLAYETDRGPEDLTTKPEVLHHDKHKHKHRCGCMNMGGHYMDIASHCTYTLSYANPLSPVCKPDCGPHHPHPTHRHHHPHPPHHPHHPDHPHQHKGHGHDHHRDHHHQEHDHDHPHHHKGYNGDADPNTNVEMRVSSALDKAAENHHHHHHDNSGGNEVISTSTPNGDTIPPVADIKNNEKRSRVLHQYQPRRPQPNHHHYPHAPRSFCPTDAIECPSSSLSSTASECIWPNEDLYNCGGCSSPSDPASARGENCEKMEGVVYGGSYCYEGRCYASECDETKGYVLGSDGGRCEK